MPRLRTGGVLKRSTRADCKSAGYAYVGSNPTPSTRYLTAEDRGERQYSRIDLLRFAKGLLKDGDRETQSEPGE